MSVKVNKKFLKMLDAKIEKGLLSSADFLKKEIKKTVGKSGGASNPGEPPKKQTGQLQRSIKVDPTKIKNKEVKIGSDEQYSIYLEAGTINMRAKGVKIKAEIL